MVRDFLKKTFITALSAAVIISSFGTKVSAASYVSGSVGGLSTYGYVTMASTSATATTGSNGAGGHVVSVRYIYGFGTEQITVSNSASNSSTISATAYSQHYGSVSLHAYGTHSVYAGTGSWTDYTSI